MIGLDLLAVIVGLNVFALFHHVLDFYFPKQTEPVSLVQPLATAEPASVQANLRQEEVAETPEPDEEAPGRERFADKFTDGESSAPKIPIRAPMSMSPLHGGGESPGIPGRISMSAMCAICARPGE
jgi:hypothetical protein